MNLNRYIDHTLLAANATALEIEKLCKEAVKHDFFAVCVNSSRIKEVHNLVAGSKVKIAATIGFPLGASSKESKISEARVAITDGADEIDMVINIGNLKDGDYKSVQSEIEEVKKSIGSKVLKVIIETCYLSEKEIRIASELVMNAGADFVKTSTGFGTRGASLQDVKIMKEVVGDKVKIKASGGIRDADTARKYIEMGVDRIGTSSGIKIIS